MSGDATLDVFGYGSLIFAPECPDELVAVALAELRGYRRRFNKRSLARACPRDASWDAFPDARPGFLAGGVYASLALGLEPAAGGTVVGTVLSYRPARRAHVLAALDRREGYAPDRPSRDNGYLRVRAAVERRGDPGPRSAFVYPSNLDPDGLFHVPPELDDDARARILVNATPRLPPGELDPRARGLYYLEGVRAGLHRAGIVDAELERTAAAVHRHPGPWCAIVAPPREAAGQLTVDG